MRAGTIRVSVALTLSVGCILEDHPQFDEPAGVSGGGGTMGGVDPPGGSGTATVDGAGESTAEDGTTGEGSTSGPKEQTSAIIDADASTTGDTGDAGDSSGLNDSSSGTTLTMACGDGIAEGSEECDGMDFAGESCQSVRGMAFDGGALSCIDCGIVGTGCCVSAGGSCMEALDCCGALACSGMTCS